MVSPGLSNRRLATDRQTHQYCERCARHEPRGFLRSRRPARRVGVAGRADATRCEIVTTRVRNGGRRATKSARVPSQRDTTPVGRTRGRSLEWPLQTPYPTDWVLKFL